MKRIACGIVMALALGLLSGCSPAASNFAGSLKTGASIDAAFANPPQWIMLQAGCSDPFVSMTVNRLFQGTEYSGDPSVLEKTIRKEVRFANEQELASSLKTMMQGRKNCKAVFYFTGAGTRVNVLIKFRPDGTIDMVDQHPAD